MPSQLTESLLSLVSLSGLGFVFVGDGVYIRTLLCVSVDIKVGNLWLVNILNVSSVLILCEPLREFPWPGHSFD
jgi:hypothetical protein